jgi:carboxyl-terminal processing protease
LGILLNIVHSLKWLTIFELLLFVLNFVILIWYAVPIKKYYRWVVFLPSLGVIICIMSIIYGDITYLSLAFYILTLVIFLCTVKKIFKPTNNIPVPKHRILRGIICFTGVILMFLAIMTSGEIRYNPESNLSNMSYSKAFDKMNERMSIEYPFGDLKKIDWQALKDKYEPIFEKAEKDKDKDLYYKTLREYLYSIRDGHIEITNENSNVRKNEIGGGFGISTIQLDDGRVLVALVLKDSPADKSGIKLGAEIIKWDGKTGKEALTNTSWTDTPVATNENKLYEQGRFMVRAQIGKEVQVEFKNMDENDIKKATLKAYDDNYETLTKTKVTLVKGEVPVESKVLDNGYGYIKIKYFLNTDDCNIEKVIEENLKMFQDKNIKDLIIDLRNNPGGDDDMVANILGHFTNEEKFYEYVSYYNKYTKKFEINDSETRTVNPSKLYFDGKIAILINNKTGSSGEGMPIVLKGSPNIKIIGFTPTNGSFGVISSPILFNMPDGYVIQVPDGRSLNKDKIVQGDSDYAGHGGGVPDVKIPLNEENFKEKYINDKDVELDYAIAYFNSK